MSNTKWQGVALFAFVLLAAGVGAGLWLAAQGDARADELIMVLSLIGMLASGGIAKQLERNHLGWGFLGLSTSGLVLLLLAILGPPRPLRCPYCDSPRIKRAYFGGEPLAGAPATRLWQARPYQGCISCGEFFEPPLPRVVVVGVQLVLVGGVGAGLYFGDTPMRIAVGFVGIFVLAGLVLSWVDHRSGRRRDEILKALQELGDAARDLDERTSLDEAGRIRLHSSPKGRMFDIASPTSLRGRVAGALFLLLPLGFVGFVVWIDHAWETSGSLLPLLAIMSPLWVGELLAAIRMLRGGLERCFFRAGPGGLWVLTVAEPRLLDLLRLQYRTREWVIRWEEIVTLRAAAVNEDLPFFSVLEVRTKSGQVHPLADMPFAESAHQLRDILERVGRYQRPPS